MSQPGEKYMGSLIGLDWGGDRGEFGGRNSPGLDSDLNFVGNIYEARVAGPSLALLIQKIRADAPSAKINLLSHSLGAEVLLAGLQALHDSGARAPLISTAITMEAAVPAAYLMPRPAFTGRNPRSGPLYDDFDSFAGRYMDAPLMVAPRHFLNFYSTADSVLRYGYRLAQGGVLPIGLDPRGIPATAGIKNIDTSPGTYPACRTCGVSGHSAINDPAQFLNVDPVVDELVRYLNGR